MCLLSAFLLVCTRSLCCVAWSPFIYLSVICPCVAPPVYLSVGLHLLLSLSLSLAFSLYFWIPQSLTLSVSASLCHLSPLKRSYVVYTSLPPALTPRALPPLSPSFLPTQETRPRQIERLMSVLADGGAYAHLTEMSTPVNLPHQPMVFVKGIVPSQVL